MRIMSAAALVAGLCLAGSTLAEESAYSDYVSQVDDRLVLAGALDLDRLRSTEAGEVLVVDLRTAAEGTAEEAAAAEALGLGYANIPVSSVTVDPTQVAELRGVLEGAGPEALVVVHCATGNRAGMLWGAVQVEAGRPVSEVRQSLSDILTKQPAIDGLAAYAASLESADPTDVEP